MMVACLSPADNNYDETLSTLRYANRAKNIKNKPKINEDPKDAMLREYQEEIQKLKAMLEKGGGSLEGMSAGINLKKFQGIKVGIKSWIACCCLKRFSPDELNPNKQSNLWALNWYFTRAILSQVVHPLDYFLKDRSYKGLANWNNKHLEILITPIIRIMAIRRASLTLKPWVTINHLCLTSLPCQLKLSHTKTKWSWKNIHDAKSLYI